MRRAEGASQLFSPGCHSLESGDLDLITNRQLAESVVTALAEINVHDSPIRSWEEYREQPSQTLETCDT